MKKTGVPVSRAMISMITECFRQANDCDAEGDVRSEALFTVLGYLLITTSAVMREAHPHLLGLDAGELFEHIRKDFDVEKLN